MFIKDFAIHIKKISKPRVLQAPIVALYQPYLYAKGLRSMGYNADYMVFDFAPFKWLARGCDIDLQIDGSNGLQVDKTREIEFLLYAIDNYDIFHFHSGFGLLNPIYSLWERLDDIKYLKKMGKKVVISWWGCDVRTEQVDIVYPYSACNECEETVRRDCNTSIQKKELIQKAFELADLNLSNGDLAASYKNITWIDNPIDCNEWKPISYDEIPAEFRLPKTEKTLIYHSFGNSQTRGDVKGTQYIKEAVERLQSEGYKVEFIFFDNIESNDLKYFQAQADIVIDQLRAGWYGSTAVECMSIGKPVVTYIRPEVEAILPHKHPVINANIDNIYSVIKDLLDNESKWKDTGKISRQYAQEYHHYTKIAEYLDKLYKRI
ncbi:MAG: glycosyltransferase [Deltaproteobacteria bacterium]